MGPLVKTILVCISVEVALAALCWPVTGAVVGSVLLSAFFFGPASLFIGPALYAKFKRKHNAL